MGIVSNTVNYLDGETVLEAFFAVDEAIVGQRPAVLIAHMWGGRDDFVAEKAKQLAALGYVGFALDMYGKGVLGTNAEQNGALMQPFMHDRGMLQKRINAALQALRLLPWVDVSKIAAIGYCFGGLCVLDLARSGADVLGVVSFHGLLDAPEDLQNQPIKAKVLALHGHEDPLAPVAKLQALQQEMTLADVDWQVHVYGHQVHAFTNPRANDLPTYKYNAVADQRAWCAMQHFLRELFG
ncbi:MAG: carboxymethylenebutenolidase [Methylococcaceae bacterium]|nr:carboxymethylenebutenolidase [Methylococcaceae bacterium]